MYNRDAERLLELLSTFFHKSEIYRKGNFIFLNVRGFDYILEVMGSTVDINRNGRVVGEGFSARKDSSQKSREEVIDRCCP